MLNLYLIQIFKNGIKMSFFFEKKKSMEKIIINDSNTYSLKSNFKKEYVILTPKFKSNSTANYLSSLGFKNIITLDFGYEYYCQKLNFNLAVLKSGDFRDDDLVGWVDI